MHSSVLSEFDAHFGDHCNHFRGKEEKENLKPAIEIILLKFSMVSEILCCEIEILSIPMFSADICWHLFVFMFVVG